MGANESRESSRTDEEKSSENGGMPNDNHNGSNAGLAAGANNESRERSRTDEERSSENDAVSNIAIAAGAAAGAALLAWGFSGMLSSNSGQSQGKESKGLVTDGRIIDGGVFEDDPYSYKSEINMGFSNGSSSSKGGSQIGGSGAGKVGGGGRQVIQLSWSTPPSGWIKVNTDGSCRGTGSIGAGGLLRNEEGDWIKGFTYNIGYGTVQEAELLGILNGLSLAWENGFKKVLVECDSSTAVSLLDGVKPVHPLFSLISDCKILINKSWDCDVIHVYREQNKAADHLAGLSFGHHGYHVLDSPPASLEGILVYDKSTVAASRSVPADLPWA